MDLFIVKNKTKAMWFWTLLLFYVPPILSQNEYLSNIKGKPLTEATEYEKIDTNARRYNQEDDELLKTKDVVKDFNVPFLDKSGIHMRAEDIAEEEYKKISKVLNSVKEVAETEVEATLKDAIAVLVTRVQNEVCKALRQRKYYEKDKRFNLGYQFNRLRSIRTAQFEILQAVDEKNRTEANSEDFDSATTFSLNMFEMATKLDTDIKNVMKEIENIRVR